MQAAIAVGVATGNYAAASTERQESRNPGASILGRPKSPSGSGILRNKTTTIPSDLQGLGLAQMATDDDELNYCTCETSGDDAKISWRSNLCRNECVNCLLPLRESETRKFQFLTVWDWVIFAGIAFTYIFTPIEIALYDEPTDHWLFYANLFICATFLVNIVVSIFRKWAKDLKDPTLSIWFLLRSIPTTPRGYYRELIWVDVIGGLPINLLCFVSAIKADPVLFTRLVVYTKAFRFIRIFRIGSLWQSLKLEKLLVPRRKTMLFHAGKFIGILVFICHEVACGWLVVGRQGAGLTDSLTWITKFGTGSYLNGTATGAGLFDQEQVMSVYTAALYFIGYTVTTIGLGDIAPTKYNERIIYCFIMLGLSTAWIYVTANATLLLNQLSKTAALEQDARHKEWAEEYINANQQDFAELSAAEINNKLLYYKEIFRAYEHTKFINELREIVIEHDRGMEGNPIAGVADGENKKKPKEAPKQSPFSLSLS